jgi:hypothetical protein
VGQRECSLTAATLSNVSTLYQYGFFAGSSPGSHFEGAPASSTLADADVAQIVANLKTQGVIPEDQSQSGASLTAHLAMIYIDDTVSSTIRTLEGPAPHCMAIISSTRLY